MRRDLKLSKHRYLELQHWCLQYPEWEDQVKRAKYLPESVRTRAKNSKWIANRQTESLGVNLAELTANMETVKRICREASKEFYPWLFRAITKGSSFNELKMVYEIPCERDMFYDRRRLFFWLLDKEK